MIKYRLTCAAGHEFEAWFASSASYDAQIAERQVSCPECASPDVGKAIMAPNVAVRSGSSRDVAEAAAHPEMLIDAVRHLRRALLAKTEDVGERFPEEARKIHRGDTEPRAIRGEASADDAQDLLDEGIEILVLPELPEENN